MGKILRVNGINTFSDAQFQSKRKYCQVILMIIAIQMPTTLVSSLFYYLFVSW